MGGGTGRHQLDQHAVGVDEAQHLLAEPALGTLVAHPCGDQPVEPEAQRPFGDEEGGDGHLPEADAAAGAVGPREKGQDGSRLP